MSSPDFAPARCEPPAPLSSVGTKIGMKTHGGKLSANRDLTRRSKNIGICALILVKCDAD